jgi:glycosyltransferase involved in cell wall biosynthesis
MPKVSVLMPTYNAASFLNESIPSVLTQTYTDFELIIVDNCSTDNSPEVIAKYLSDKRVKYHVNERNIGPVRNFNKCLALAEGDFIKFLCADDKFTPQLLEKFVSVMEEYPNVLLVGCAIHEFGLVSKTLKPPFYGVVNGKKMIHEILNNYNYLGHPTNVMIRKEGLDAGNFKTEYIWLADWEFWLRILSRGDCFIIPEELAYTRMHQEQVTQSMIKSFSNYFETYNLVKAIKKGNELNLDFSEFNIEKVIKKRAKDCTLALPWALMAIQKKQNREVFKKALNIAYKEQVLIDSFFLLSKKLLKKVSVILSTVY